MIFRMSLILSKKIQDMVSTFLPEKNLDTFLNNQFYFTPDRLSRLRDMLTFSRDRRKVWNRIFGP